MRRIKATVEFDNISKGPDPASVLNDIRNTIEANKWHLVRVVIEYEEVMK